MQCNRCGIRLRNLPANRQIAEESPQHAVMSTFSASQALIRNRYRIYWTGTAKEHGDGTQMAIAGITYYAIRGDESICGSYTKTMGKQGNLLLKYLQGVLIETSPSMIYVTY